MGGGTLQNWGDNNCRPAMGLKTTGGGTLQNWGDNNPPRHQPILIQVEEHYKIGVTTTTLAWYPMPQRWRNTTKRM